MKQNNQNTTHIDPQVGTGGMVMKRAESLAAEVCDTDKHWKGKGREITGICLQCVWQRAKLTCK